MSEEDEEIEYVSKSQIKREFHALTDLGVELVSLPAETLANIPMSDALHKAIEDAKKIKKNSAMKRQRQYIGKLIRNDDYESIQNALNKVNAQKQSLDAEFKSLERWRDQMLTLGNDAINAFIAEFHEADRQKLRQLVKNANKEKQQNSPPVSARKLFKYIREIVENSQGSL